MRAIRPPTALAMLAALALTGCASWNDRYPSNVDSARNLFGLDESSRRDWPSAELRTLAPLSTDSIPDRRTPAISPWPWWPPLAPAADGEPAVEDAPGAVAVDPARAADGERVIAD